MDKSLKPSHFHPIIQLVVLILVALICGFACVAVGFAWFSFFYGFAPILEMLKNQGQIMDIPFMRTLQISSTVGIFILGPLVFAKIDNYKVAHYFKITNPIKPILILLTILIVLFSSPLFEAVNTLNQKMALPSFLHNLEKWMKQKELEAAALTQQLLIMKSYNDLAINLLMVAILPAIGEELFFRGAIQNILINFLKNPHLAIWFTAIVFSAIHVQFYGFLPRMFLGVLFGYLFLWGKSIWLPILAHFLNNGFAVIMAFKLQLEGKSISELENSFSVNWYALILSSILTFVLLKIYFKKASYLKNKI